MTGSRTLVGFEVEREPRVVALDEHLCALLDGLCPYATHCGCCWRESSRAIIEFGYRVRLCQQYVSYPN